MGLQCTTLDLFRANRSFGIFRREFRHTCIHCHIGLADIDHSTRSGVGKLALYDQNVAVLDRLMVCQHPELKNVICCIELDNSFSCLMSYCVGHAVTDQLDAGFLIRHIADTACIIRCVIFCHGKIQSAGVSCRGSPALCRMLLHHTGFHHIGFRHFGGVFCRECRQAFIHCHIGLADIKHSTRCGIGKLTLYDQNIAVLDRLMVCQHPELKNVICCIELDNSFSCLMTYCIGHAVTDQLNIDFLIGDIADTVCIVRCVIGCHGEIQSAGIFFGGSPSLFGVLFHNACIHHIGLRHFGGICGRECRQTFIHCHIGFTDFENGACSRIYEFSLYQ